MSGLSAASTILLAHPGFVDPRHVRVGNLSTGWRVNGAGRLSCHLGARDAHLLGYEALLGRWVWTTGPVGPWAGYVEDLSADLDRGIVELSCSDMAGLLGGMVTPRTYRQTSSSAGALIGRTIRDSPLETGSWIARTLIDEAGPPVTIEWRGEQTLNVIRSLANGAGGVWWVSVEADKTLTFSYLSTPTDKRSEIQLVEGHSVLSGSIRPSISQLVNDLFAVANDRDWERSSAVRVIDGRSVRLYDRRKATRRYEGHTRPGSLQSVARADLATLSVPSGPVSLDIAATNPIVSELRIGILVGLRSRSLNRTFDLTISGIAHDTTRGAITVVGTVVEAA